MKLQLLHSGFRDFLVKKNEKLLVLTCWVSGLQFVAYKKSQHSLSEKWSYYLICGANYWPTYKNGVISNILGAKFGAKVSWVLKTALLQTRVEGYSRDTLVEKISNKLSVRRTSTFSVRTALPRTLFLGLFYTKFFYTNFLDPFFSFFFKPIFFKKLFSTIWCKKVKFLV